MAQWPDAAAFREAFQNPRTCFIEDELREASTQLDVRGFPLVYSGNFASVFKVRTATRNLAVRCFLREVGDRQRRYQAIEQHLSGLTASCISHFEYVEHGIRVRGRAYPILIMDWVDGLTLDAYVRSTTEAKTFQALAARWIEIIAELERSQIGHGDLQHGNILVSSGDMKLVDYDGMFVPSLKGQLATETGHRAYQHPARTEQLFGLEIDRFSSLVIYLSLAALSERPALTALCSGDNLLFHAADYRQPERSAAIAEVRKLSPPVRAIADALVAACAAPISRVPRLLDLVQAPAPSQLPTWMRPATDLPPPKKILVDPPRHGTLSTPPTRPQPPSSPAPIGGQAVPHLAASVANASQAPSTGPGPREFDSAGFSSGCLLWVFISAFLANSLKATGGAWAVGFAIGAAWIAAMNYKTRPARTTAPLAVGPPRPLQRPSYQTIATGGGMVVASSIRSKYHRPTCDWAKKMSARNRITFASGADARARGYRPCKVCRP